MLPKSLLNVARFAEIQLGASKDKSGRLIIYHCLRVLDIVNELYHYNDPFRDKVALLHEVIEDGGVTYERLNELFGRDIADAVEAISRRNKEDYMEYIRRCAQNSTALEVKIADLKHNMDITHLDKLTNEDLKRLKKYHKAYRYLWGIYNAKRDD